MNYNVRGCFATVTITEVAKQPLIDRDATASLSIATRHQW